MSLTIFRGLRRPPYCGKCRRFCSLLGGFCGLHDVRVTYFSRPCADAQTWDYYLQTSLFDA